MSILKTEAIILSSRKSGETSKILTMLTRHYGKISLMAKGARSTKSKYLGVLETFNHVSIVFYHKETRGLQYISQAEIIEPFPSIHQGLGKMALAAIPLEIVSKTEPEGHSNPRLFDLVLETLKSLEAAQSGLTNIIRAFQIHFLNLSGMLPNFEKCFRCGRTETGAVHYFDIDRGVYYCEHCGVVPEVNVRLSANALENVRWLSRVPISAASQARISARLGKEIDFFLVSYLRYHFEGLKEIRAYRYLDELSKGLNHLKNG